MSQPTSFDNSLLGRALAKVKSQRDEIDALKARVKELELLVPPDHKEALRAAAKWQRNWDQSWCDRLTGEPPDA